MMMNASARDAHVENLLELQADLFERSRIEKIRDNRRGAARTAVFMPIGTGSIHDQWITHGERSWDFIVYCYDDTPVQGIKAEVVLQRTGTFASTKFFGFARLIKDFPELVWNYDYWMLMDNDIRSTIADVQQLFALMAQEQLDMAQPALTEDSPCYWKILKHQPGSRLRYLNAVEIMTPILSRRAVQLGRHLFRQAVSGFGIDLALGKIVREQLGTKPAVIDAVTVKHTKEIDHSAGKFYTMLRQAGISPFEELDHLLRLYQLDLSFQAL